MSAAHETRSALPAVHEMDFHGDRLLLVDVDGKPHVVLRPAVEALGLSYSGLFAKLQRKSWAVVRVTRTTGR